jgi:hypothetical protein
MKEQRGYIFHQRKSWFVRYCDSVLQADGSVKRVQVCKKLDVPYCDQYRTKASVRPFAQEILAPVNNGTLSPESTMAITEFVEKVYLPKAIVLYLKEHPEPVQTRFRMADFASFALKVGTLWGCREEIENALTKLEAAQSGCALEADPIHQVLDLWLRNEANHSRPIDAGTLHQEWGALAKEHQIAWPFANGRGLAQALGQLQFALREQFEVGVGFDSHKRQNRYQFGPKQPKLPADNLIRAAKPEEVLELAGFAGFDTGKP